jgi:type IV pilus assembly protein PilX
MSTPALRSRSRARGASLITALIFLVIMAMLSVTLAGVTSLEERMASNTRDRDLALQAAEAALRDAEQRLALPAFRSAGFPAFVATRANGAAYWEGCFSSAAPPCNVIYQPSKPLPTLGPGAVAAQPRFVIERKPNAGLTEVFRVTARAVGGAADTIVVLQTELGVTP